MRLISLTLLAVLPLMPQVATAQNPICEPTGGIVADAVEARRAGQTADTAREAIAAGLTEAQAGFAPAVQPLVDWVYELPEDDLAKDVAGAWVTQCEAQ
ncbi:MAG: DNA primase [Roseovarius sp.]|nr:DNA primase [Roseovarius sp.]